MKIKLRISVGVYRFEKKLWVPSLTTHIRTRVGKSIVLFQTNPKYTIFDHESEFTILEVINVSDDLCLKDKLLEAFSKDPNWHPISQEL